MAGNLTALAALWATMPASMTTSDKLAQFNGTVVAGPSRDVRRSEIRNVLAGAGVLAKLQAYVANPGAATQPCLTATNYLLALITYEATLGDTLKTSDPTTLNSIETLLPDLLADANNGMTQGVANAMMALITPLVPWWQANGFSGPVLVSDLIAAGNLF